MPARTFGRIESWTSSMPISNKLMVPPDHISGLQLEWLSATGVRIKTGEAYVPAFEGLLPVTSDIDVTGLSLAASTWYYVYIYETPTNTGTASVEVVTTAPAAPYRGAARTKTADTSRRYIGALKTNAASQLMRFSDTGLFRRWLESITASPIQVYSVTTAPTTPTTIDCSGVVPLTSHMAIMGLHINRNLASPGADAYWGNSEMAAALSSTNYLHMQQGFNFSQERDVMTFPLNAARELQVMASVAANTTLQAAVYGYIEER